MPTRAALLLAPLLLALAGCGGGGAATPVAGTVTVRGKGEANLLLQFNPLAAGAGAGGSATSGEGGKFTAVGPDGKPGLKPGVYLVTVVDRNLEVEDDQLAKGKRPPPSRVDRKYQAPDEKTNPLKITVQPGQAAYDIALD